MTNEFYMIVGFALAAYSVTANDSIQTLGTFLSSNARRPWWVLWIFAGSILAGTLLVGWMIHDGDVSYGRLSKTPMPETWSWIYCIPPLFLLGLTRFGVPVSTTFLVLTVFAPGNLPGMLTKSLLGYAVAFVSAIIVYRFVALETEKRFIATSGQPAPTWVVLQWCSTGFLWSQWLIQDLANIYVFLPRQLSAGGMLASTISMVLLLGLVFYFKGGRIQRVVTTKSNTVDIRSATIVDLIYGCVLLVFKEVSHVPMSTTWVFVGLLAGRELALTLGLQHKPMNQTLRLVGLDLARVSAGLLVSIALAFGLPYVQQWIAQR